MTNELSRTAYHEAGHAVIGRVLGLTCGQATIRIVEDEGEAGHPIIADPHRTAWDWNQKFMADQERVSPSLKYRELRSAFRATILARMAGAEAEVVFLGQCQGGDEDDRLQIDMMAASYADFSDDEWERYEPRMRRHVRRLVWTHRAKI